MTMLTTPYQYQIKGARAIHKFGGRALLADACGLGKTIQALMYLDRHPDLRPAIVVCPASLKYQWQREAMHHCGMLSEVLNGTNPPHNPKIFSKAGLLILNYEILSPTKRGPGWLEFLKQIDPKVLIVDEAHCAKNRGAQRTKAITNLSKTTPGIILLTGTPITNAPAELWSLLHILRPEEYPAFWSFGQRYCNPKRIPWGCGWDFSGASHLDELHEKLQNVMIRRLKKDVLKELPDKTRTVIELDLSSRTEYRRAEEDFIGWLKSYSPGKANRAARAERLVKSGYLRRLTAQLKLNGVMEWTENFLAESEDKLVMFCSHTKIIRALKKQFTSTAVVVDGSVSLHDRQKAERSFQHNPKTRLFLGNIRAAGVGLNLTAASSLAFIELDWLPGIMEQAEDRIHRIGQKNAAQIYYLIGRDTIEQRLLQLIQRKSEISAAAIDGKPKGKDFDVFDLLCKELLKEGKKLKVRA